jgi:arginyl-tRNA--protein-N-Asp/Glu arginylyltransferase
VTQHSRDTPQFYLTAPSPCPYLPGRHERKVFTHLVGDKAGDLNDLLTHGGFRRSQSIAYRPACDQCRACVSVRVVANEFRPSRNFRKVLARNADISGEQRSTVPTSEQYSIFRAYLDARHRHGGMADMTVLDYAMMVEDSHVETRIIEYRRRGEGSGLTGRGEELVAVALTDVLSDGLSMVYSFFDPSEESRSLGTFRVALRLSRLLDRGLQEDGLQGPLSAAAAACALGMAAHRRVRRSAGGAAGLASVMMPRECAASSTPRLLD